MDKLLNTLLLTQVAWLFLLSIPVACVAWTVTHEEVFSEMKNFAKANAGIASHCYNASFFTCSPANIALAIMLPLLSSSSQSINCCLLIGGAIS